MNKLIIGIALSLLMALNSVHAEVSPETVVNIFTRLEKLETKTRELNGENEVLQHQLKELKKRQKEGFLNVDERIEGLGKSKKPEESKPQAEEKKDDVKVKIVDKPATNQPSTPTTTSSAEQPSSDAKTKVEAKPKTPKAETDQATPPKKGANNKKTRAPNGYERETYQAAFVLMKKSPTAATKAFEEYIRMQPESPLAANAQYWIGEIMYSHNNYKGAVQEFIKVLQKYKYSDKAPDAAIKLGYSFYALKNWAYAKRTFEDVIKYFPENQNAVNLAKRRLDKIKAAGH